MDRLWPIGYLRQEAIYCKEDMILFNLAIKYDVGVPFFRDRILKKRKAFNKLWNFTMGDNFVANKY